MLRSLIAGGALAAWLVAPDAAPGAPSPAPGLLPAALTVHLKDFRFTPTPARINAGDRVTFVNDDDEAHTVTAGDKSFDSQGLDGGETWQHVFTNPGTYVYFCRLHPHMKAEIVVRNVAADPRRSASI